jgi:hypothetical protein
VSALSFGVANDSYLNKLPVLSRFRFRAFLYACRALGYNPIVTSGLRTTAQQARLVAINPKNAKAGTSTHEKGIAIDLNFVKGAIHLKKASPKADWDKTGIPALALFFGVKWGGTAFANYYDPVHFELMV